MRMMDRHAVGGLVGLALLVGCAEKKASPAPDQPAEAPPGQAAAQERAPRVQGPLPLGTELPSADVEMEGVDGETITLGGIAGEKGTLVVFTCNHCPYAQAWEERIAEIANAWSKKGFGVALVNPNDPSKYAEDGFEAMKERAEKLGLEVPYVVDATSDVARAYGATKTPEVYLFDADRKLVYHGAVDDNAKNPEEVEAAWLKDALEAVASNEDVPMAETKAVGCSIKFRPAA